MKKGSIYKMSDDGKTWEAVGTPAEVASYKVKISHFVWDPKDPSTVYMSGDYGNLWQSTDGGGSWKNILNLEKLPRQIQEKNG